MDLVIIESPNKEKSISKYLGENYEIFASVGHVRDLPAKELAINTVTFEPKYVIMPDKQKVVRQLKEKASKAEHIYLATDPDREGEAIAWHIANILNLDPELNCRVTFNEISKTAVQNGMKQPRKIDKDLVDAQQARRILDRFVGYEISPILCKNIKNNLSAGRVQSVALKMVVDREREILAFKPQEYHTLTVNLTKNDNNSNIIKTNLESYNEKKIKPKTGEEMQKIVDIISVGKFTVKNVKKSVTKSKALPPFTTSTMQQDAINKLGFTTKQTSALAQQLYEGVELKGEGKVALVTYIRSDSVRVSEDAVKMAKEYILKNFGADFYPAKPNVYKSKENIQDGHEAIRPISLEYTPERVKSSISPQLYKLYKLIYNRFLASQMSEATFNSVKIEIDNSGYGFTASGKTPLFMGYNKVYKPYTEEVDEDSLLPEVELGETLNLKDLKSEQKFTKPSPRYTESSINKALEEKGIGRPATYAQIISTILDRGYVERQNKYLVPTEIGMIVNDFLVQNFPTIINEDFTAQMETKLDKIATEKLDWKDVISKFYAHLSKLILELREKGIASSLSASMTDKICDKCGAPMLLKNGKNGSFYACSKYPECKNTKPLIEEKIIGKCPQCGKNFLEKISKKGTKYYACEDYKNCKLMLWGVPTGEKCPQCGGYLYYSYSRHGKCIKCANNECNYIGSVKSSDENKAHGEENKSE